MGSSTREMVDKIAPERRSRVMARVSSKDTKPEVLVRSLLHQMGFRFRLHRKSLPGCPDICLPKYAAVIFVHGCFWHGHSCSHGSRRPTSNADYWNKKIDGNMLRDEKAARDLKSLGWRSLILWECQLKNAQSICDRVQRFLKTE